MGIVIIGSGNWGATFTGLMRSDQPVRLWCESQEMVAKAHETLKNVAGADRVQLTVEKSFSSPLTADDIVVLIVPSSAVATVSQQIRDHCNPPYPVIVSAAKGLDRKSFRTMSQVVKDILPEAKVAVISGPNIAQEIAAGRPAKAMLGCPDVTALVRIAKALGSDRLFLDMTRDTVDLELCAVMKGVFAIGSGVIAGRQWGANFMGLLLTFGLREIVEISRFLGISNSHVLGVAGLGDLVTTCFSPNSRNYRLGELLAQGVPLKKALREVNMVVEGAMTAAAVSEMASLRLHLPLFAAIAKIVEEPSDEAFAAFEKVLLEYAGSAG
jgi:glycerol-3-phosphate dehydrogenase (NAD(P)+)